MRILLRLFAQLIEMLLHLAVQVTILLLGCFVRLLYWSVRVYGWGRVFGFFGALTVSGWVNFSLLPAIGRFDAKTLLIGIPAGTLLCWGIGWAGLQGVHAGWQEFLSRLRQRRPTDPLSVPSTPNPLAAGSTPVTIPPESGPLWEQVIRWENLLRSWQRVEQNGGSAGLDGVTLEAFTMEWEARLRQLQGELQTWRYRPQPPRWVEVPKRSGGVRRLSVFNIRDRIAQQAVNQVLLPLWDGRFAPCSYAYRPGRGAHQAIDAVERDLKNGRPWIVDADIEKFFDSVPHRRLTTQLESWLPETGVRSLLSLMLTSAGANGLGLPQGSAISPLLSNLYLHAFDEALLQRGYAVHRYADDLVLLCPTQQQAEEALTTSHRLLKSLELRLNETKTRIVHINDGFDFLGFTFTPAGKRPSDEAIRSLHERIDHTSDDTKRQRIATGWRAYFGEDPNGQTSQSANLHKGKSAKGPMSESTASRFTFHVSHDDTPEERDFASLNTPYHEVDPPFEDVADDDDDDDDDVPWFDEPSPAPKSPLPPFERGDRGGMSDADWNVYRQRFVGRGDLFARYWQNEAGQCGYVPVRQAMTKPDVEAHLSGQSILGTYLFFQESCTRALVFDVDGPTLDEAGRQKAHHLAMRLMSALGEGGISPLLFDSGGKGRHLWLCFTFPVPAKPIRQWAQSVLDRFRPFPDGVLVEVFPKQDVISGDAMGAMLRLPLGKHPQTARFGSLLDEHGNPVTEPWTVLRTHPLIAPSLLGLTESAIKPDAGCKMQDAGCKMQDAGFKVSTGSTRRMQDAGFINPSAIPHPPEAVAPMIQGCALLRGLVEKATREHDLKHTERLSLLYTLGHCGDAGCAYLHQVISQCSNYNSRITERFIQRLEQEHKSIRCATLHEWLKDYLPGVTCDCPKKKNPSPLDLLKPTKKAAPHRPRTSSPPVSSQEWETVAEDLFDFTDDA